MPDDPIASCWALLKGRGEQSTATETADALVAQMQTVNQICANLEQGGDPSPQVAVALSLVRQAALVAATIGREDEPAEVLQRLVAARLALVGYGVPHGRGRLLRARDCWGAIFLRLQDAARELEGVPADHARRGEVAIVVADELLGIAGCETPPDTGLVQRAIEAIRLRREDRGPVLLELMRAVGHPSRSADSLERSIRRSIGFVRALAPGEDDEGAGT